ncbi:MAG: hypothetical protein K2N22_03135, partial [Clostridia bacterium]|nr:hypothetical protein [Clostridia bacterium]
STKKCTLMEFLENGDFLEKSLAVIALNCLRSKTKRSTPRVIAREQRDRGNPDRTLILRALLLDCFTAFAMTKRRNDKKGKKSYHVI